MADGLHYVFQKLLVDLLGFSHTAKPLHGLYNRGVQKSMSECIEP